MFLNPGIIHKYDGKYLLGNKEYTSLREFLLALPMCHTVAADLVINLQKIMPAGIVTFSEVNGYIIANVDTQFNFGELKNVSDLKVRLFNVTNASTIIIQSENIVNEMIDDCDTDADIYFKVGSIIAGNTNICDVPESFFTSLHTNNIPVTNFSSLSDFVTTPNEDNNQEDEGGGEDDNTDLEGDEGGGEEDNQEDVTEQPPAQE